MITRIDTDKLAARKANGSTAKRTTTQTNQQWDIWWDGGLSQPDNQVRRDRTEKNGLAGQREAFSFFTASGLMENILLYADLYNLSLASQTLKKLF